MEANDPEMFHQCLEVVRAGGDITVRPLPRRIAEAKTHLVWRSGHQSRALEALRRMLPRYATEGRARRAETVA
jgi:DNA-binding transcriptional LysR family regulator